MAPSCTAPAVLFFYAIAPCSVLSRYRSAVSYRLRPTCSAFAPEALTWIVTGAETFELFWVMFAIP